jgi:ArsR family transcriptional regulator
MSKVGLYDHLALLGDPVRVRLLRVMSAQEVSVGELTRVVQLPQSTVSRHLKELRAGGWIASRSSGPMTLLRLADEPPDAALALWPLLRDNPDEAALRDEDDRRLQKVLEARRLDSRAYFGSLAGHWDAVRRDLFGELFWLPTLLALRPRAWTVADLGCGTGAAAALLAPHVHRVLAVDREQAMLDAAAARLDGLHNVELLRADLEALPLNDASLDAALCLLVLHHLDDPSAALRETSRVLAPQGRLVILDIVPHEREEYRASMGHKHLGFSRESLQHHAEPSNLSVTSWTTLPSDPDARGPSLFVCALSKDR